MKKYIDADKLKAEIERRYAEYRAKMKTDDFTYYEGMADALDLFEQYIDSLQQEQPEADLEEEMVLYSEKHFDYNSEWDTLNPKAGGYFGPIEFDDIARHFFELGQKDAANKYDEIEYNRQRADEETLR